MCIKDMINEAACYELDRSVTARMGISKNGSTIKAVSVHQSCSTPLWQVALVVAGTTATVAMVCYVMKKCRCHKTNCEE
ncbi:MAG: hypothetical protein IKT46_08400 [Clostridia bacterium]|nr:hypothetical protein [Clostridia bacterium]